MVHQNFLQVDTYSVTENIALGTDLPSGPAINLAGQAERMPSCRAVRPHRRPGAMVEDLSVGLRQRVEILKALYRGAAARLDEPTTNLTPQEVDSLFGSIRAIVDEGMCVVLITHKIRETMAVCDTMTVMRDGRRVGTVARRRRRPPSSPRLWGATTRGQPGHRGRVRGWPRRTSAGPRRQYAGATPPYGSSSPGLVAAQRPGRCGRPGVEPVVRGGRSSASPGSPATGRSSWPRPSPASDPLRLRDGAVDGK